jgi:hypothetical protein
VKTCSGHTIGENSHGYDYGRRNQEIDGQAQMDEALGSAAWKAVHEDVKNFATGGVTALLSKIEV